jgi:PAS domain S-box-containing protein
MIDRSKTNQELIKEISMLKERIFELEKESALLKLTQDALRESDEKYRRIIENSVVGFFQSTPEGRFLHVNPAFARMVHYESPEDFVSSITDIAMQYYANPEDREKYKALMVEKGHVENFQFKVRCKDGSEIWVSNSTWAYFDENGEITSYEGLVVDVTEQKRAEEALRASERRLGQIIEFLPDATFAIDIHGNVTIWNRAMELLTGIKASDILGKGDYLYAVPFYGKPRPVLIDMVITEDREMASSYVSFYEEGDRLISETYLDNFMGGGPTWLWNTASPLYNPKEQIVGAIESIRDITKRKWAEEALRKSEEKYRELVAALPQAVFESDTNGCVRYVNDITYEMFGYDSSKFSPGKYNITEMIAPEDRERMQLDVKNILSTGKSSSPEYLALRKDGSKFPVQVYPTRIMHEGIPAGIRGIILDISEHKRAEEEREKLQSQLIQAQKMESVGRLAGGVAHDFNNMLGIILGHTEMILDALDPGQPLYSNLTEIQQAAERSVELTKQLLAFARKQTITPRVLDLNETVESILKMLRRLIGEDIDLVWQPGKNLWPIKMDSTQIDQILANLCSNARDAISDVGEITIETKNIVLQDDDCIEPSPWLVPGEYVLLTVSDDGMGIKKKDLENIFDPFFTTKEVGKGTGLGLPMVYGIVKQNSGFINVYSEVGEGTICRIYLPRHVEEPEAQAEPLEADTITGGDETVLLVEDEPILLKMGKAMLEKLGYRVLSAVSPTQAIKLAEKYPHDIDLLITDIVMPGMNGRDMAARIKALYPKLKCLFMSGYTANVVAHRGVLEEGLHFMQKPFSMEALAKKTRETLED